MRKFNNNWLSQLIPWFILGTLTVYIAGCQQTEAIILPLTSTPAPVIAVTPYAGFDPTDPKVVFRDGLETSPLFQAIQSEMSASVSSLEELPGNIAAGETAPDFIIKTLDGGTVRLSDWQSHYVLLLPTTPGCGECMVHLNMLDSVYPDYRGQGVQVVLLDLTAENDPGYWQFLANNIREPEYVWGVADSADFALDYEIKTLGTILLIDPDGSIVYRSEKLIPADSYRQLFELATSS